MASVGIRRRRANESWVRGRTLAHANPTRLEIIRLATEDLASKLSCLCPGCGAPGFWIVERIPGLPCENCGTPTGESHADRLGSVKCAHRVTRERADRSTADPERCDYCNP